MILKGLDIFLTWKQYDQILTDKVKNDISKIPCKLSDDFDKWSKIRNQILYDETRRQMSTLDNATEFIENWLKFDIEGVEAKENAWNLISDFCTRSEYTILADNRRDSQSQYAHNEYQFNRLYPLGQSFSLVYKIPRTTNWYGKILQRSTECEIVINTQKVKRLSGEFKSLFTIYFEHKKIIFGRGLSVLPYDNSSISLNE